MSYLVLARKWRPQTFEEIVGQQHVSQTLTNAIRGNRVAHAFLFTGVRGVGKTTAARILAKALNCEKGPTPEPCNVCTNCVEITNGNAVDVLEVDGASNTGVDDVREIIENVRYQPAKSRFKIYIIDEVHMLSTSAFNALLKTLEEPPAHVKFIFATTDPHKVPHTIHSRCQRYDFKRISYQEVSKWLQHIAHSEGIEISDHALFLIAREGEGSMRDAQSLFDQVIAYAGKTISDADVTGALGLADRKQLYAVGAAIAERNPGAAVALLDDLHQFGYDLRRFARELLEHMRNLAVARVVATDDILSDLPEEERKEVRRQAERMSQEDIDRAFRLLIEAEAEVGRVPFPKLLLEMTLIKLTTLMPIEPIGALLERVEELSRQISSGQVAPRSATSPAAPPSRAPTPPSPSAPTSPRSPDKHVASAPTPGRAATSTAGLMKEVAAPAKPNAAKGGGWGEFLSFVTRERVLLLPYLQACDGPRLEGDEVVLRVAPGHMFDFLSDRARAQGVEDLLSRFMGHPMRVSVEAAAPPPPAESAADKDVDLEKVALAHPKVQAALKELGGEVHEVRSRPRKGKGSE